MADLSAARRGASRITVPGDVTLETVNARRDLLWPLLDAPELEVRLTDTGRIDLAGLQMLLYFERTRRSAGRMTCFSGDAVERFRRMAHAAGIALGSSWSR